VTHAPGRIRLAPRRVFCDRREAGRTLADAVRLGRAIGVIYLPATERQSHYYHVRPGEQFDAIIHIDTTRALEPLEMTSLWVAGETPETYPTGL
jgi:erythromycin esterase-like protein